MNKEKEILPIGLHKLSAIQYYKKEKEYWGNSEGYYVVIDNVIYAFEYDPDDGYRSFGSVYIVNNMSIDDIENDNRFTPQDVFIEHISKNGDDADYTHVDYYEIKNPETTEIILKIGTDFTDSYYPMAIFEFNKNVLENNIKSKKSPNEKTMHSGYVSIVRQTWQERYDMYMKHTKEELASMLAERAKYTNPDGCAEFASKTSIKESENYAMSSIDHDSKYKNGEYEINPEMTNITMDVSSFTYCSSIS